LSGVIPASDVDIPLEPDPYRERGVLMGSGGLVILDDTNCIVDLCVYFEWFAEDESCGRCTTCFAGTRRMLEILRRISSGRGRLADLELIKLLGSIAQNANCFHGQGAPTAVMSMFRFFEGAPSRPGAVPKACGAASWLRSPIAPLPLPGLSNECS